MLQKLTGSEQVVAEWVADIGALFELLDRRVPGLSAKLADPIYNVAVNDEMLLHGVQKHPLHDGDVVEIIPTIAGG